MAACSRSARSSAGRRFVGLELRASVSAASGVGAPTPTCWPAAGVSGRRPPRPASFWAQKSAPLEAAAVAGVEATAAARHASATRKAATVADFGVRLFATPAKGRPLWLGQEVPCQRTARAVGHVVACLWRCACCCLCRAEGRCGIRTGRCGTLATPPRWLATSTMRRRISVRGTGFRSVRARAARCGHAGACWCVLVRATRAARAAHAVGSRRAARAGLLCVTARRVFLRALSICHHVLALLYCTVPRA